MRARVVQLERVDALKAQLRRADRRQLVRPPTRSRESRSSGRSGLKCTESPSGENPEGLPAAVRPTKWKLPVMIVDGTPGSAYADATPECNRYDKASGPIGPTEAGAADPSPIDVEQGQSAG